MFALRRRILQLPLPTFGERSMKIGERRLGVHGWDSPLDDETFPMPVD
jgi:hypothetical protein